MHIRRTFLLGLAAVTFGLVTVVAAPATAASTGSVPAARQAAVTAARSDRAPQGIPIPFIYDTGEQAYVVGPLPEPWRSSPDAVGWQAGYYCSVTGVFWSDFWIRDCKAAAVRKDEVITAGTDPEMVAAIEKLYSPSAIKRGAWDRFGWMLILGAAGLGLVLTVVGKVRGSASGAATVTPVPPGPASADPAPAGPGPDGAPVAAPFQPGQPVQPGYPGRPVQPGYPGQPGGTGYPGQPGGTGSYPGQG